MSDALWMGRRFRTCNVIDEFKREGRRIEVDTSLSAAWARIPVELTACAGCG